MFTGMPGVGKTAVASAALSDMAHQTGLMHHAINFSAQTQADSTQVLLHQTHRLALSLAFHGNTSMRPTCTDGMYIPVACGVSVANMLMHAVQCSV